MHQNQNNISKWVWLLPTLVAFIVSLNTLGNGFALDDEWIVEKNTQIRSLSNVPEIFTSNYWQARGSQGGLYRPLTIFTYALNHALHKYQPAGYHLVNLLLHTGVTLLSFLLIRAISKNQWAASIGALLFAVHPIHCEAVANVVGRAELLSAAFGLLMLYGHHHVKQNLEASTKPLALACAALSLFAALLCKENSITLIPAIALFDICFYNRNILTCLKERWSIYLTYGCVCGLYLIIRFNVLGDVATPPINPQDNPIGALPFFQRLGPALAVAGRYAVLLALPFGLSHDHGHGVLSTTTHLADPYFIAGLIGTALLGWVFIRNLKQEPALAFAAGFTAITYSVASNILIPIGVGMGERLMYLPSFGLVALAGIGLAKLCASSWRKPVLLCLGLLVFMYAGLTWARNPVWKNNRTLFLHDAENATPTGKILYNAGLMTLDGGGPQAAIPYFERSLDLFPDPKTMFMLGRANGQLGDDDQRLKIYDAIASNYPEDFYGQLAAGFIKMRNDDHADAIPHFEQAVSLKPYEEVAQYNLGAAYYNLEDYTNAIRVFESLTDARESTMRNTLRFLAESYDKTSNPERAQVIRTQLAERFPDEAGDIEYSSHISSGLSFQKQGDHKNAIESFKKALTIRPNDSTTLNYLGIAQFNTKSYADAIGTLQQSRDAAGQLSENSYQALGLAYENIKDFDTALTIYDEGLTIFTNSPALLERSAVLYYGQFKNFPKAFEQFKALLVVRPDHPQRSEFEGVITWLESRL